MEDLTNSQKIIDQRKTEKLWEECCLRLKRILAQKFRDFMVKSDSTEEIAGQLKELKASYETGLQAIKEKWITKVGA